MKALRVLSLLIAAVLLTACAKNYRALVVDAKSGTYPTSTQVDPGGVLAFVTTVDPKNFPVVILATDATIRPSIFEFTVRNALAQAGLTRVLNIQEFRAYAKDKGFDLSLDPVGKETMRRYSEHTEPVLLINMSYLIVGEARWHALLAVTDGRTGQSLLNVDHPKLVWSDADGEVLYPVLNQLRDWIKASAKGRT